MPNLVQSCHCLGIKVPTANVEVCAGSVAAFVNQDLADIAEEFEGESREVLRTRNTRCVRPCAVERSSVKA
jgi:hypothetical protein